MLYRLFTIFFTLCFVNSTYGQPREYQVKIDRAYYDVTGDVQRVTDLSGLSNVDSTVHEFNRKGAKIRTVEYRKYGDQRITEYTYDDKDRLTYSEGRLFTKRYFYDQESRIDSMVMIMKGFEGPYRASKFSYPKTGEIQMKTYNNGKLHRFYLWSYQHDLLQKEAVYRHNSPDNQQITEFVHNEHNQVIKEVEYSSGSTYRSEDLITYDANGHVTSKAGDQFSYEYDQRGNWLKKKTVSRGSATEVTRRVYYFSNE